MNRTCTLCGHVGPSGTDFYGNRTPCKPCVKIRNAKWKRAHPESARRSKRLERLRRGDELRAQATARYRRYRDEALAAYGGRCVCCGERQREFLSFDHVNNDGAAHRRSGFGKSLIVFWLRTHGYPSGFQILCHNCNLAKGFYGACPHEAERARAA